jgi:hypothetical protein
VVDVEVGRCPFKILIDASLKDTNICGGRGRRCPLKILISVVFVSTFKRSGRGVRGVPAKNKFLVNVKRAIKKKKLN